MDWTSFSSLHRLISFDKKPLRTMNTMNTMNHSPTLQESWQVSIYRYSKSNGWNYFQMGSRTMTSSSSTRPSSTSNAATNTTATTKTNSSSFHRNRTHKTSSFLTATPTPSWIEISHLRVKIPLVHAKTGTMTRLHRRRNQLLIHLERGILLLHFLNVCECVTFCDRLVSLNPAASNAAALNEHYEEKKSNKQQMNHDQHCHDHHQQDEKKEDDPFELNHRMELQSYLIHLIHDDDFMAFVDRVEDSIMSDASCTKMMEALIK